MCIPYVEKSSERDCVNCVKSFKISDLKFVYNKEKEVYEHICKDCEERRI
jgi:hypothetical protein